MKRLLLLTLAAAVAISLVTVMSVRSLGGSTDVAHAQVPQLALDLDGSGGWCSDIDATDSANVGEQHQAAICLLNSTTAAKNLDIVVLFNTQLNDCTNTGQSGTALDANPDFVGQGTGFDCSLGGLKFPYCKTNNNETPPVITSEAFITCGTTNNPGTLSGPEAVAVITWTVAAGGTDNLTFGVASVSDQNFEELVSCPSANCLGATVTKGGDTPEPTATSTRLPTATATRTCGGRDDYGLLPAARWWWRRRRRRRWLSWRWSAGRFRCRRPRFCFGGRRRGGARFLPWPTALARGRRCGKARRRGCWLRSIPALRHGGTQAVGAGA